MAFICTALILPEFLENRAVQEKQVCKSHSRDKASRVWDFQAKSLFFHLTAVPGGRLPETACQIQLTNMGKLNTLPVEIMAEF